MYQESTNLKSSYYVLNLPLDSFHEPPLLYLPSKVYLPPKFILYKSSLSFRMEAADMFHFPVDFAQLIMPTSSTRWKSLGITQLI